MELMLVATFRDLCSRCEEATKSGVASEAQPLIFPEFSGTPVAETFENWEAFIAACFRSGLSLNPKTFRVGLMKMDSMYGCNISGEVTFAGRANWAARNARLGHSLVKEALRKVKAPVNSRHEVITQLKQIWSESVPPATPSK